MVTITESMYIFLGYFTHMKPNINMLGVSLLKTTSHLGAIYLLTHKECLFFPFADEFYPLDGCACVYITYQGPSDESASRLLPAICSALGRGNFHFTFSNDNGERDFKAKPVVTFLPFIKTCKFGRVCFS